SVFMECTIFHTRLALTNSRIDIWGESELDSVICLWRHLVGGICDRIKAGYLVDVANRSNSKSACSSIALSSKSSPYCVDIPASHETIIEVDNYSVGCFSKICRPLCRNKVGKRAVTTRYH
uniref:Uncharacterized protein n=1 Tax=Parascaris univalens TaxID=6257 RepID=A0A915A9D0_PARUN